MVRLDKLVNSTRMLVLNVDIGLRIVANETLHEPVHVRQANRINRGHANAAGDFFMQRADFFFQGKVPLHQFATAFVIDFAFRGQHEGSLSAVD